MAAMNDITISQLSPNGTGTGKRPSITSQNVDADLDKVVDYHVPVQYRGTEADKRDMLVHGKQQELRRNFKFLTMTGFSSMIVCAWEGILALLFYTSVNGGSGMLFFGFIATQLSMLFVYLSIAEMASMSPTAAGQYSWVSEFAPPKYQRLLSYLTGWLCATGWNTFLTSVAFMVGTIIQGLIALNQENYGFQPWHGTLLTIAIICLCIFWNITLAGKLPLTEGVAVIVHICGLFAVIIPLWCLAPIADASALTTFVNYGGWPSTGLACMVGIIGPLSITIGYDSPVHMAEEIHDASRNLPKAILAAVGLNAFLSFLMIITLVFTMGDGGAEDITGYPFITIFYNAVQHYGGVNAMVFLVIFGLTNCAISETATASRQVWSFARDNGLPFSRWLSQVSPSQNIPIRAVTVCFTVVVLLSLINLGSNVALNAINSLAAVSLLTSYMLTIGCLIWRRLYGEPLPPRKWSLGPYGLAINCIAFTLLLPLWFFAFWPLVNNPGPADLNWAVVIFFGVLAVAGVNWVVKARHVYIGPAAQIRRELEYDE